MKLRAVMAGLAILSATPAFADGGAVSVQNGMLTRGGQKFIVKGLQIVGFVSPPAQLSGDRLAAYQSFNPALMASARNDWNANTIRFMFHQSALDPQGANYSSAYLDEIRGAVAAAEQQGLAVIATVQDEGEVTYLGEPTAATLRADQTLVHLFGNDGNVMLDVYNEPKLRVMSQNHKKITTNFPLWDVWKNGGTDDAGRNMIGFQTIVTALRAAGSRNVLVLEGGNAAAVLTNIPTIEDPLNNYAYAAHPYLHGFNADPENWDSDFGYLADQHRPVLVDEWSAPTADVKGNVWCRDQSSFAVPAAMVQYLKQHQIGVVGWAFDLPGTIVQDHNGTPNGMSGKQCGDLLGGPGEMLKQLFHEE